MTVIVWDGKILAADKKFVWGNVGHQITKLYIRDGMAYGGSGDAPLCESLLAWFRDGASEKEYPSPNNDKEDACLLVVKPGGAFFYFAGGVSPVLIEDTPVVLGSGREPALGAMHAGANAIEAVRAANAVSDVCGMGINYIDMGTIPLKIRSVDL